MTSSVFKIGGDITSVTDHNFIALGFHPLRKIVEYALNEYIFQKELILESRQKN